MILIGKIKTGLGDASFWVEKIEAVFYKKTKIKLFFGTLNIELLQPYELQNYFIIKKEEYGGTQDVYVQECKLFKHKAYIVRAEKTVHKSNVLEIVSNINFRQTYNLKDKDEVKINI